MAQINDGAEAGPSAKQLVATKSAEFDAQFEDYKKVGTEAKAEYERIYKEMFAKLSVSNLEPFMETLRENEKMALHSWEPLADGLRAKLQEHMLGLLEIFWRQFDVDASLASLEMLKEKFKEFEGTEWNMYKKTVYERTRPWRMNMKIMQARYLERQVKFQNQQLEELYKENKVRRERIQEVTQRREFLLTEMSTFSKHYEEAVEEMDQMIDEVAATF